MFPDAVKHERDARLQPWQVWLLRLALLCVVLAFVVTCAGFIWLHRDWRVPILDLAELQPLLIFLMCCIILALGFDPFRKSPPPGGFRLWQGMWLPFSSIILAFGLDGLNILSPEFSTDLDSSIGGGLLLTALAYVLLLSALHPWQKVEPTSRRDPGASRPSRLMWFMVLLWPIGLALLAMPLAIPGAERILIQVPVLYESTLQSQWIFGFMFAMYMLWWRWRYWGALAWRGSVNPIPPSITAPANGGADAS